MKMKKLIARVLVLLGQLDRAGACGWGFYALGVQCRASLLATFFPP